MIATRPAAAFAVLIGCRVDDFREGKGEVVLSPDEYKAGSVILRYSSIKHASSIERSPPHDRIANSESLGCRGQAAIPPAVRQQTHPKIAKFKVCLSNRWHTIVANF